MRVAMLAPFALHPKGTTRWRVLPLAAALAAAGHQVGVFIPPYDWPQHSGRRWLHRGVEVCAVTLPQSLALAGHSQLAWRLAQAALAWQPDVVHCFKPKGYSGLAGWLLAQRRLPLVVDADDWEQGWNALAGYPAAWRLFFGWQERRGLRRAGAVTAASRWLVDYARSLRAPPAVGSVFYLPNGVEPAPISPAQRAAGDGRAVLLYTRFVEHSPAQVWQVWRRVLAEEPASRLLVAGRGRQGEEIRLAQLAAQAGGRQSVTLLGWLPAATRPGLLAAADLALLPVADTPLNRAKSPMRLLELLAAGVPVATQAVGEYGCYVRAGETGLATPAGDEAALAAAVLRLARDPALRVRLAAAAAQRVRQEHAWPRLAGAALAAYQSA